MARGDAQEWKWRGNWRMEWVASTHHTTSEHGVSSITTADAHTLAASSRLNWRLRRFKWTRPFRRKTKSGFCACVITFQTQSNTFLPLCRQVFFFVAYCTRISSSCRTTAVTIPSLLPHEQPHNAIPAAACVAVNLSLTYLFTTLHHVIHTICFLLAFTSTTHGSCSLLHKAPLSSIHYTYLWLDCGLDKQVILVRLPGGTAGFHLLQSPDRL